MQLWVGGIGVVRHRVVTKVTMTRMLAITCHHSHQPGYHIDQPNVRTSMTKALDFFNLFFTADMEDNIVRQTNTYALLKVTGGTHRTYCQRDGSWKPTTPDVIRKLVALLLYFGLVRVGTHFDRYWSTKTLYHGLWARAIMPRLRYRALMGFLHVVDPTTETPGNKLRKVQSFIDYFRTRCKDLYQPRQNVAVDERMVKSRHRSGIRQYIRVS